MTWCRMYGVYVCTAPASLAACLCRDKHGWSPPVMVWQVLVLVPIHACSLLTEGSRVGMPGASCDTCCCKVTPAGCNMEQVIELALQARFTTTILCVATHLTG
jgi:hypothetical protein